MALIAALCLLFVAVVASAPHNDAKMRGFAPCTYQMAEELSQAAGQHKMRNVITGVGRGYWCYVGVMRLGAVQWAAGKQPTPWANYLFEPETYLAAPGESEPFSEDLLKANMLDDDESGLMDVNDENKESTNDEK